MSILGAFSIFSKLGALKRLIPARAGALIVIALVATVIFLYMLWRISSLSADLERAQDRADQYQDAHESALEALEVQRAEAALRERLYVDLEKEARARRARERTLTEALTTAREEADEAYRGCLDVELPAAVRDGLRNQDRDDNGA